MGCSQKRCTKGGDRVRGCITHLLSIKNSNVDGFHVSVVPPKTWPICDIVTGTIKSALGHVLHAMLLNKTNLPENNICSALHTILKSYDNCHGFCKKKRV